MNRVVHFEFATSDPEREIDFFTKVFGWKIEQFGDQEYWLADSGSGGDGINGAITKLDTPDQPRVVNVIDVDDIEMAIVAAVEAGARVVMPRQQVEGVGITAGLLSPTGILFGIIQAMDQPRR